MTTVPEASDGHQFATIRTGSVGANVRAFFAIEQSASDPPIPKPIASTSSSASHVNTNAAWADGELLAAALAGLMMSMDDQPAWVGSTLRFNDGTRNARYEIRFAARKR